MRVLVVCQHYWPEPFNVSETCEELARRGHEVTVLTAVPNYPSGMVDSEYRHGGHRDENVRGVRVVRVPVIARGKDLRGLNKVRRVANYVSFPLTSRLLPLASDDRFDCVLAMQFSPVLMAIPALRIAKKQGIPCLLYCFDLWPEDMLSGGMSRGGVPYAVMRAVSRRVYESADRVCGTSPGFEEYFAGELGLQGIDFAWLPQYAEEAFEQMDGSVPAKRPDGRTVFAFAGNVAGNQSVETVVRAAALLDSEGGPLVRIAGAGSRLEDCRSLARQLGAGNVEFLGRLPLADMPGFYASADAMLLTLSRASGGSLVSKYTIPRKVQSYLAASKPILAAVDGAAAEVVYGGGCGFACPAEDAEALAEAMRAFSGLDSVERTEMGRKARVLYDSEYSRERFFARLEAILEELSSKGTVR